jgi:inner membrane protein
MGGIASLWLLLPAMPSDALPLAVVFASLGSLLPDLDARESKLSNARIGGVAPIKPLARALNRRLGHRGAMHSLLAALLVSAFVGLPLALFLDPFAGLALALGYLSHLALDACTKSGVPLYWPDAGRVWLLPSRLRVTTGSAAEDGLFVLLSLAASGFLLTHLFFNDHATIPTLNATIPTLFQAGSASSGAPPRA